MIPSCISKIVLTKVTFKLQMRVEGLSANKTAHFSVILEVGFRLTTLDKISVPSHFHLLIFISFLIRLD